MRIIKIILFVSTFTLSAALCHAQSPEIKIKSVTLLPMDRTAIDNPVLDNNGDTCALIKIKTDHLQGLKFTNENQYVKVDYNDGIYWVYMPTIFRKLDFGHNDFMPAQLDMTNYGYRKLKGGKTYLVELESFSKKELKSSITLHVEPENANVTFDGNSKEHKPGGTYTFPDLAPGSYSCRVSLDNYMQKVELVNVGKSEAKTVTVRLQPIMHLVNVSGNLRSARILVDNVDYGKVGKVSLPQGVHNIRIIADGYNDYTQTLNINANTGSIFFRLDENKLVEHIHATPVTIYSYGTKVFKNNKEIKEWKNNNTVNLMPGKYMISDDMKCKKKIVVGKEPMKVYLW